MTKSDITVVDKTTEAHTILNEAHWAYHKSVVNEKIIYTCLDALEEALPEKDHANQIVKRIRMCVNNSRNTRGIITRLKHTSKKILKENNALVIKLEKEKELRIRDRFFFFFIISAMFIIFGLSHIE